MNRAIACVASLLLMVACGQAPSGGDDPALITVFGAIDVPRSRGVGDPETEPLFAQYGLVFEDAAELSWQQLASLDQYSVEVDFPAGGPVRRFSGPLLRDVMDLVHPQADEIVVTALDGYQRQLALMTLDAHDVMLAIRLDDRPLSLGGLGPAMVVWPRSVDPVLAGMPDDDWVWGVFAIEVRNGLPRYAP